MATETVAKTRTSARVHVQKFGTFLSGMIMPNIGAFIAWGFITAFFIPTGWFPLWGIDDVWVQQLGGWSTDPDVTNVGLVGPMITYLLPLLIGYTGGKMVYDVRGGVVGAIKGPIARAAYWTNQNIIDAVVNAAGAGTRKIGRFTYDIIDQKVVDGTVNGIGVSASET
ncbi:MAG: hypothetical protein ACLGIS_13455, partial [Actinomycetes bacterium]